jgi:hypothetical protein
VNTIAKDEMGQEELFLGPAQKAKSTGAYRLITRFNGGDLEPRQHLSVWRLKPLAYRPNAEITKADSVNSSTCGCWNANPSDIFVQLHADFTQAYI